LFRDFGQGLWRSETVAEFYNVLNFRPVDLPSVKPKTEPSAWTYVGRQIEPFRFTTRTVYVLAKRGLTAYRDDSIAVVVIEEVREDFLTNAKVRVVTVNGTHDLRQRHT
jgi:hypothetical protein